MDDNGFKGWRSWESNQPEESVNSHPEKSFDNHPEEYENIDKGEQTSEEPSSGARNIPESETETEPNETKKSWIYTEDAQQLILNLFIIRLIINCNLEVFNN